MFSRNFSSSFSMSIFSGVASEMLSEVSLRSSYLSSSSRNFFQEIWKFTSGDSPGIVSKFFLGNSHEVFTENFLRSSSKSLYRRFFETLQNFLREFHQEISPAFPSEILSEILFLWNSFRSASRNFFRSSLEYFLRDILCIFT